MTVQPVRLVTNIETAEAKASHRGLKDQVVRDHAQMQGASSGTDRSMLRIGQTAARMASVTTAGLSAVSAGFSAATASAQSATTAIASMTASIVAGFSSGGIVGVAVASAAAGIGWLIGETQRAEAAAAKAASAYEELQRKAVAARESANSRTLELMTDRRVTLGVAFGQFASEEEGALSVRIDEIRAKIRALHDDWDDSEAAFKEQFTTLTALQNEREAVEDQLLKTANARRAADLKEALERVAAMGEERTALREIAELRQRIIDQAPIVDTRDAAGGAKVSQALASLKELERTAIAIDRISDPLLAVRSQLASLDATVAGTPANEHAVLEQIKETKRQIGIIDQAGSETLKGKRRELVSTLEFLDQILDRTRRINDAAAAKAAADAKRIADERARAEAEAREQINESIRREIDLTLAATEAQRAKLGVLNSEKDLRDRGANEGILAARRQVLFASIDGTGPFAARQLIESMAPIVTTGLSDLIADGITTGFRNGASIARQIVDSMLRSLISQIVNSGIQQLMGSLLSGGLGGGTSTLSSVASVVTSIAGGGITGSVAPAAVPIPAPGGC